MKVLFDFLSIRYSDKSGIYLYAQHILDGWYSLGIKNVKIMTHQWNVPFCNERWPEYEILIVNIPEVKGYSRKAWVIDTLRQKAMRESGCDILFYPMPEATYFKKPAIPQVSVIHDMYAPKVAKGKQWVYQRVFIPKQMYDSKHILSISEYTKQDVLKYYTFINPNKISVVHNSIVTDTTLQKRILDYGYILCVNTIAPYKNGETLMRAFGTIKDRIDVKLVFVGIEYNNYWDKIIKIAKEYGCEDRVVHLQNIPEQDLTALYQHAKLFVSPSTMEGFGQTPIEAAIHKCPVITSKATALPETTLGILNYYDPVMSHEALATKMMEILENPPSEEELSCISNTLRRKYDICEQGKKVYDLLQTVYNSL